MVSRARASSGAETVRTRRGHVGGGVHFGGVSAEPTRFPGKTETDTVARVFAELGAPHDGIWPGWSSLPLAGTFVVPHQPYNHLSITFAAFGADAVDLLTQLLTYDPAKRCDAARLRAPLPGARLGPAPEARAGHADVPEYARGGRRARRELGERNKLGDWNRDDDRRGRDEDPDPRGLKKRAMTAETRAKRFSSEASTVARRGRGETVVRSFR